MSQLLARFDAWLATDGALFWTAWVWCVIGWAVARWSLRRDRRLKLRQKRCRRTRHRIRDRYTVRIVRLPLVILKPMDDVASQIVSLS